MHVHAPYPAKSHHPMPSCTQVKWEGEVRDGSGATIGTASGKVHLPYVAEENHGDDPELKILLDKEGSLENKLKQVLLVPVLSTMRGAPVAGCVPV